MVNRWKIPKEVEDFVLKRDLMPFFESNEDYETCSEIISLTKDLTK